MNVTCRITDLQEEYVALYDTHLSTLQAGAPEAMNALRGKAIEEFKKLGIPSNKVEDYKYTNLQPHFKGELNVAFSNEAAQEGVSTDFNCQVPELQTHNIFFVNGWYSHQTDACPLPEGVIMGSIREKGNANPELLAKYYGRRAPIGTDGPAAMNTAFAQDGAFIYIPKSTVLKRPIQIVNIMTGDVDRLVFQRNIIIADENSQAKIMFCDHTLSSSKFVVNTVSEIFANESSVMDVINIQNQHNNSVQVAGYYASQKKHSNLMTNNMTLHAGLARNNVKIKMEDEHCEAYMNGLYLCDKNQHVDNFTFIDHAMPHCNSNELFKGVMDDGSTGAFTGRVLVRKDAQQTNAFQSNNNLILTESARINTKPQLEIYADDVKCSHGATVGQLDEEAMFYLRARGINTDEARVLLMFAFAYEVIEKIRVEPVREQIRGLVERRFRGEFDKCSSCVACGDVDGHLGCL